MLRRLWQTSPELITTAVLMLIVLAGAIVGLAVDPTVITGAPAWLKPAKFAASIAIYTVTLAWFFTFLPDRPRMRRRIGWATALTMVIEMAIIGTQAWRGTTSHFNLATPLDATLFRIMGLAIVSQTLITIGVATALWRQRFDDAALGWALRLGMCLTIAGALTGGLMARPSAAQLAVARGGAPMTMAGAHTIGAADGGPGLPGTGWSTEHGDLRVAHFFGLHAMQTLPFVALILARRRLDSKVRVRLVLIAATSYATLYAILVVEALRGVSFIAPDAATVTQLGVWAAATATAAALALLGAAHAPRHTAMI